MTPDNPRVTLHFTPTGCSWLNMVEIFIGRFIDAYNDRRQPFTWTKDADELIAKIRPSKN